jgi:hypothetical protein
LHFSFGFFQSRFVRLVQFATGKSADFSPELFVVGRKPLIPLAIFVSGAALISLAFLMLGMSCLYDNKVA